MPRLLFSSYHCYLDPSSGAAHSLRDLFPLLAERGWECRVFCGPHLDYEHGGSLEQLLTEQELPYDIRPGTVGSLPFACIDYRQGAVPVTIFTPAATERPVPAPAEGHLFLALLEQVLDEARPDVLLTYGGHWVGRETIAAAARRKIPVAFWLRNFAYTDATLFRTVAGVLVPSQFSKAYYRQALGLDCTAIPSPLDWSRLRCTHSDPTYVAFVNPQPTKGVTWFARIAYEMGRRRPDIPFLVVEGRGGATWLDRVGLDLGKPARVDILEHTPDPREFYALTRVLLAPSLWLEAWGRVAAEAMINGIPVLGTRRGGLPEILSRAGFVFDVPERFTRDYQCYQQVPTADEVSSWIETIERLWDDGHFYETERRRCLVAAEDWTPAALGTLHDQFFRTLSARSGETR
jgi:glycosyltransferase involved in cell wall biosynthesis